MYCDLWPKELKIELQTSPLLATLQYFKSQDQHSWKENRYRRLCDTTVWTLLHIATVQNCEVCVHKVFHAFCSSRANPVCRLESGNPYHIWFILAILDIQQGLRHRIRSHHSKCQNENLHSLLAPHCNSTMGPDSVQSYI